MSQKPIIFCRCGKSMEDTGKKIEIETSIYLYQPVNDYLKYSFSLFACRCGKQIILREPKDDEMYEI